MVRHFLLLGAFPGAESMCFRGADISVLVAVISPAEGTNIES